VPDSRGPEQPDGLPEFGEDPEYAGDELSSVVFDERFVRAATIHEPSAAERTLAAAPSAWTDAEDAPGGPPTGEGFHPSRLPGGPRKGRGDADGASGRVGWWRQSVAWVLALMMGIGVVAMAVTAVTPSRPGPSGPQPTVGTPLPRPEEPTPASTAPAVMSAVGPAACVSAPPPRLGCA
jgi:hypothetical protein